MKYYLAIDIGASSGRHIIGYLNNNEIITDEVYRFSNENKIVDKHLTWDIDYLFHEVKNGIKIALKKYKEIESMSIDTWGVDYVLMHNDTEILPCYAYRDKRMDQVIDEVHNIIPFDKLYSITGCQYQPFNTIYQLYADNKAHRLDDATDFLMMPEYLMYKLTGIKKKEYTNAGTMGLLALNTHKVSKEIISKLGIKESLFKELSYPKDIVGYFTDEVIDEVGGNIKVVLCATHDTASAVCGISMNDNNPYISSGTWSLLGIKSVVPYNNEVAFNANYSNELGPNYFRVQKNIMGLWIIQCISKELNLDFVTMMTMAKSSSFNEIFNVNDKRFLSPTNMVEEIKKSLGVFTLSDSDVISSAYHSLAYSYAVAIKELESITNSTYNKLYIVGGGAKNTYLNELTEKYTNKKVIALPIEATSIGNLLIQMEE